MTTRLKVVHVTPNAAGEKLGLRSGDIVVAYAGQPIANAASFLARRRAEPPAPGELVFERDGVRHTVTAAPGLLGVELRTVR